VWTHLTGVYDAAAQTLTLYVNGVAASTVGYTTAFAATGGLAIGRSRVNGASADFFDGNIAEVRTYPTALEAGQVAWLAQHSVYAPATATGAIVNAPLNKCLDDFNRNLANGAEADSYDCNASAAQGWTLNADGSITTGGQCLDVVGGGTANQTDVELWTCDGSASQRWSAETDANGNVHLVNANSGRCLDDPAASPTNDTRLQIYDCISDPNQVWAPQERTNLAAGQTASSSSQNPNSGWAIANLADGVYRSSPGNGEFSSVGSAGAATEQWAQVDLGSSQKIDEVDLYPRDETTTVAGYCFPVDFTIQVSADGASWTTVVTETGYAKPGDAAQAFGFNVVSARYVRVDATKLSADQYGTYYLQLRQLAVRGA
jgi:ricin-type beta-trefoil lectin protein/F5/8 type C domain-containing protein/concanavalin A-like lectin/glucanase superfamily protein